VGNSSVLWWPVFHPHEETSALSLERGALTVEERRRFLATYFFIQYFYPKQDDEEHRWIFEALK